MAKDGAIFDDPNDGEFSWGGLFNTAIDVGKNYLPKPANPKPAPQQVTSTAVTAPTAKPAWLTPVIIGVGIVVVLVLGSVMLSGRGTK